MTERKENEIQVVLTLQADGNLKIETNTTPLFAIKIMASATQRITDDLVEQIREGEEDEPEEEPIH